MTNNKVSKIITFVVTAIALVGIFLLVRVLLAGEDAVTDDLDLQNKVVTPLISFSTYLLIGVIAVTIVLSLLGLFKNPENLKKTFLGLAFLGVLFVVAYFLADSNVIVDNAGEVLEGGEAGSTINKMTGAGIWFSIILGAIGLFFFVLDLGKGLIKS
ncbi:hypothetical protein [uncultured Polaribacter sp.]|uniref:hypothetical protein n=1 Tax=uncultured Polaribacter sp. TaxID=174711 RepID=UPI0026236A4A|nr:hypothetical protein [uncultured Polaribacter sp.]